MDIKICKAIEDAAEEIGIDLRSRDYSGRGMYGKTTVGIVYDDELDLTKAIALAAGRIAEMTTDELDDPTHGLTLEDFIDGLPQRRDNMGRSMIAY